MAPPLPDVGEGGLHAGNGISAPPLSNGSVTKLGYGNGVWNGNGSGSDKMITTHSNGNGLNGGGYVVGGTPQDMVHVLGMDSQGLKPHPPSQQRDPSTPSRPSTQFASAMEVSSNVTFSRFGESPGQHRHAPLNGHALPNHESAIGGDENRPFGDVGGLAVGDGQVGRQVVGEMGTWLGGMIKGRKFVYDDIDEDDRELVLTWLDGGDPLAQDAANTQAGPLSPYMRVREPLEEGGHSVQPSQEHNSSSQAHTHTHTEDTPHIRGDTGHTAHVKQDTSHITGTPTLAKSSSVRPADLFATPQQPDRTPTVAPSVASAAHTHMHEASGLSLPKATQSEIVELAMGQVQELLKKHMQQLQADIQAQISSLAASPELATAAAAASVQVQEHASRELAALRAFSQSRETYTRQSSSLLLPVQSPDETKENDPKIQPSPYLPSRLQLLQTDKDPGRYPSPSPGKRFTSPASRPRFMSNNSQPDTASLPPRPRLLSANREMSLMDQQYGSPKFSVAASFDGYGADNFPQEEWFDDGVLRMSDLVVATCGATAAEECEAGVWRKGKGDEDEALEKLLMQARREKYNPRSLFMLGIDNKVRVFAIRLIEWSWFDRLILVTILFNCVIMAMDDPTNQDPHEPVAVFQAQMGIVFQVIFSIECVAKIIAMGLFYGKRTYLRDGWNCLDLFIVSTGMIEYLNIDSGGNASVLRSFRLLRPLRALRAVGRFKNLRMLVELLIGCIPMLANVFGLISFIFFVFGILGVQVWASGLRNRCYSIKTGLVVDNSDDGLCGKESFTQCGEDEECLPLGHNISHGITSFDNIAAAMLIIFQVMIQEDWTTLMYNVWDTYSFWTWPYFILLNMVGPMFAIQLFIVVVANKYSQVKQAQLDAENAAVQLFEIKVGILTANIPKSSKLESCDPYVTVKVDDHIKKTRVIKNGAVPEWNEYLMFPVRNVASRAEIKVMRWMRYGKHEMLGYVEIPIGLMDQDNEGTDKWYELGEDGGLHVRTQWRVRDEDEWVDLPDVADDDDIEEEDAEDLDLGFIGTIRAKMKQLAEGALLSNVTIVVILFNTAAMACEHDCDMETQDYCRPFKRQMELLNVMFTTFFTLEMVIKILGLGPLSYIKETSNCFDFVIVVTSIVELASVLELYECYGRTDIDPKNCESGSNGLSVLRSFRLIRVMRIGKLVRAFPQIQRQLKVITKTMGAVSSLVALMLLFILIFAILGMSLFGNISIKELDSADVDDIPNLRAGAGVRVLIPPDLGPVTGYIRTMERNDDGSRRINASVVVGRADLPVDMVIDRLEDIEPEDFPTFMKESEPGVPVIVGLQPRANFDNIGFAALTVFQLLTCSDLGDVLFPALRGTSPASALYFISLIVLGNFMLLNLFLAIIITGFSETKAQVMKEERENARMIEQDKMRKAASLAQSSTMNSTVSAADQAKSQLQLWLEHPLRQARLAFARMRGKVTAEEMIAETRKAQKEDKKEDKKPLPPWRLKLWYVANHKIFNGCVYIAILASSVALALSRPSMGPEEKMYLGYMNLCVNCFFLVECVLKILGLRWRVYIASPWNKLDFFLVAIAIVDVSLEYGGSTKASSSVRVLRILRILRALRPLRIISRSKGLRVVLGTISRAILPVLNTVAIALCAFFVFGVMAVQLIGGTTNYCTDEIVLHRLNCTGINPDTGRMRKWKSRGMAYGWIGEATLSMFVLSTQDNWEYAMYAGVDATGNDTGPEVNGTPLLCLFFVAFMIVGSFFVVQLFVGVFIDTFQTVSQEVKGISRSSSVVSDISDTNNNAANLPSHPFRYLIHQVVCTTTFELFIAALIVSNVIVMACETYKVGLGQLGLLTVSDVFFNLCFGSEVVLKLSALHPKAYFKSNWNRFDFTVVMVSFLGIAFDAQGASLSINPTILRVLRIFRLFRLLRAFRIFKAAEGLQRLVRTLMKSLGAVGNLGALLLLLFFIIGVLCVEMFGNLCVDGEHDKAAPGMLDRCALMDGLLEEHANFQDIGMAFLTLFRISTGDNWSDIMHLTQMEPLPRPHEDSLQRARGFIQAYINTSNPLHLDYAMAELPGCVSEDELIALNDIVSCAYPDSFGTCPSTCGIKILSNILFSAFLCASNFILLNLVMAVLMQELQAALVTQTPKDSVQGVTALMQISKATRLLASKLEKEAQKEAEKEAQKQVDASTRGRSGKDSSRRGSTVPRGSDSSSRLGKPSASYDEGGKTPRPGSAPSARRPSFEATERPQTAKS